MQGNADTQNELEKADFCKAILHIPCKICMREQMLYFTVDEM